MSKHIMLTIYIFLFKIEGQANFCLGDNHAFVKYNNEKC